MTTNTPTIKFHYQGTKHVVTPYLCKSGDLAVDLPTGATITARTFAGLRTLVQDASRKALELTHVIGVRTDVKVNQDGEGVGIEFSRRDRWVAYTGEGNSLGSGTKRRRVVAYASSPKNGKPRADEEWARDVGDDSEAQLEALADAVVSTRYYAPKVAFPFEEALDDTLKAFMDFEARRAKAIEAFFTLPKETLRHHLRSGVDPVEIEQIGQAELTRQAMAGEGKDA